MSTSHGSTPTRETPIEPKTVDTTAPWDTRRLDQKDTPQALLEVSNLSTKLSSAALLPLSVFADSEAVHGLPGPLYRRCR
jgi:hypothetical protein